MKLRSIDEFVTALRLIPNENFKGGTISDFLTDHPVDMESLEPYLYFSKKFYTRNLIYKNDLFELMTLCWEMGHVSRIHNHSDQNCWMAVPSGKLRIQDFKVLESKESTPFCRISATKLFETDSENPVVDVSVDEPIHQVSNPLEFNERAVSLHIYSKPFGKCLVYSPWKNRVAEVALFYTSVFGKLCDGIKL